MVGVVAVGGAAGTATRYGASLLWPTPAGAFPWTTFLVNLVGCALIGILLVLITETWSPHRLVRPFLGTGVLGGFTTFSTSMVDTQQLIDGGQPGKGLGYLLGTLLAALAGVWLSATATRRAVTAISGARSARSTRLSSPDARRDPVGEDQSGIDRQEADRADPEDGGARDPSPGTPIGPGSAIGPGSDGRGTGHDSATGGADG